jgi:N utilization substance protein A
MEVPEVYNGTVEIKGIAREAGYRSKIAVAAKQEGIDPVGCCVGLRGIRIQNIVSELNGEKIDVVMWNPDITAFIANALSPAHIVSVQLNEEEQAASVIVPDKQLSLAIGKEGQNARLAAKLSGWRIDIKSASIAEAEKKAAPAAVAEEEAPAEPEEPEAEEAIAEEVTAEEATAEEAEEPEAEAGEEEVPEESLEDITTELEALELEEEAPAEEAPEEEEELVAEELIMPLQMFARPTEDDGRPQLRFAEDIMPGRRGKSSSKQEKGKKKKRGSYTKDTSDDAVIIRKGQKEFTIDEDEDFS